MKNSKASILGVTLVILGIILLISLSISIVSVQERKASISSSRSNQAFQIADSGNERVQYLIKNNSGGQISAIDGDCDGIIDEGQGWKAELKDSAGKIINSSNGYNCSTSIATITSIRSIGISGQNSRAIEAAVAQAGGCSAGFTDAGTYCIENNRHGSAGWVSAIKSCGSSGARLCDPAEWYGACTRIGSSLSNIPTAWEWTAVPYTGTIDALAMGSGNSCESVGAVDIGTGLTYRCCMDKN